MTSTACRIPPGLASIAASWAAGVSFGGWVCSAVADRFAAAQRADGVIEFGFDLRVELLIFGDDPLAQFGRLAGEAFGT